MVGITSSAYEVTASKYRPRTFDELAGQEFVVSTIKNSLAGGQIAHAYLFSGPRGCGKTSAARVLARSLNCAASEKKAEPCGVCDNCLAISRGASMDVLEIDGASNNSVNDVRQIKDEVLFPPQTGKYKVYIIDEVHMLSTSAFNALLKTIEEPPPYIVFIFATTEPHKVPATIKSRCQQFNFRLIPIETIQGILKRICAEMKIEAEDDALFWIARESTGSMRDAFTLFDQVASFSAGSIRGDLIREKLGVTGLEKLNALAENCAQKNSSGVFAITDEILSSGVAVEQLIIDLTGFFRGLLLLKNGVTRESLLGYNSARFSAKALETYDAIRLERALDILLDCYRDIRYSVSPRFELENAVSKLIWLGDWISPSELKEAVESARSLLSAGPTGVSAAEVPKSINKAAENAAARLPTEKESARPSSTGSAASQYSSNRSLTDEFKRMVARSSSAEDETKAASAPADDEDDVPLWDSAARGEKSENENPALLERVLSMIPGTIVPGTIVP